MKRSIVVALLLVFVCSAYAEATVLTFDDLQPNPSGIGTGSNGNTFGWMSNYGGFNWGPYWAAGNPLTEPAISATPISGSNIAMNGYVASTMTVSRSADFNFMGAYLGKYSGLNTNLDISVSGYNDGILLYSDSIVLPDQLGWFAFNFAGIDQVVFRLGHYPYDLPLYMDNFTYDIPSDSVPEPSTLLLFGAGMAGIGIIRKRMIKG